MDCSFIVEITTIKRKPDVRLSQAYISAMSFGDILCLLLLVITASEPLFEPFGHVSERLILNM